MFASTTKGRYFYNFTAQIFQVDDIEYSNVQASSSFFFFFLNYRPTTTSV